MSDLKRTPTTTPKRPGYATRDDLARDRRELLILLGKGLAGLPLLGLATACGGDDGSGREKEETWISDGLATDLQAEIGPEPEQQQWELAGIPDAVPAEPDVRPEREDGDWTTGGVDTGPDIEPEPQPEPWTPDGLPAQEPGPETPPEEAPEPAPEPSPEAPGPEAEVVEGKETD